MDVQSTDEVHNCQCQRGDQPERQAFSHHGLDRGKKDDIGPDHESNEESHPGTLQDEYRQHINLQCCQDKEHSLGYTDRHQVPLSSEQINDVYKERVTRQAPGIDQPGWV